MDDPMPTLLAWILAGGASLLLPAVFVLASLARSRRRGRRYVTAQRSKGE
jgi:hypothetical protein